MKLLNLCNRVIEYSFYLLFFLVPLAFTSDTSELFEFNKLWITFIITIVIGFAWFTKMVVKKEFRLQRTLLDIPIALFLGSQVISTFFSLDPHTSLWGYYSRFNGGLLSIFAYVFLYYAFVTNLKDDLEEKNNFSFKKFYIFLAGVLVFIVGSFISSKVPFTQAAGIPFQMFSILTTALATFVIFMKAAPSGILRRSLYAIFSSAILVVLWGLPSHFGFDPTCLLFRGTFDVSCWTADFMPKIRIFSTLGQPDWLAAYLAALLPILIVLFINFSKGKTFFDRKLSLLKNQTTLISLGYIIVFVAFYASLLYTRSRSAILAFWIVAPALILIYFWFYIKPNFDRKKLNLDFKFLVVILVLIAGITFFIGQPFAQLNKFTLEGLQPQIARITAKDAKTQTAVPTPTPPPPTAAELGGTDSGVIRLLVWEGALDIWKNNPVFGTGVETYAFAYYKYRPQAHNMTSEWKYLYNKAHNEYLNYLATTGSVGIVTYLSMIGSFLFISLRFLYQKRKKLTQQDFLIVSLLGGYTAILITNFFGFSVVIINILFYLIPAFVFILAKLINYDHAFVLSFSKKEDYSLSIPGQVLIGVISLVTLYLIFTLINAWNADRKYYFGFNYNRAGDYQTAYPFLKEAVDLRPSEPVFRDELAYNNAVLGAAILLQGGEAEQNKQQNAQVAKQFIDSAINNTLKVTTEHKNNIVFWKSRVRVFYTLGQVDPKYYEQALEAIKKSAELAPTDADVSYNLGILYGQIGDSANAVKTLENTIKLKPDYSQAYYALGIFYHQLAVDDKGVIKDEAFNKKAIETMKLLIEKFGPNQQADEAIKAWEIK